MLVDSKCVQINMKAPTFQTSTEQTNVVSEFDEELEGLTNETSKTTTFDGTTMNGLYPSRFVVRITLLKKNCFSSTNEIIVLLISHVFCHN